MPLSDNNLLSDEHSSEPAQKSGAAIALALLIIIPAVAFFLAFSVKSIINIYSENNTDPRAEISDAQDDMQDNTVSFSQESTEDWVFFNGTKQLEYTGSLHDFKSSDESIVTVEDGLLAGVSPGQATVTASASDGTKAEWSVTVKKRAYITFDDSPNPVTDGILNTLENYGVKATFFLVSDKNAIETVQKIVDGGHAIGNRSSTHNSTVLYSDSALMTRSYSTMESWLNENFDVSAGKIIRLPGGTTIKGNKEKKNGYNRLVKDGYMIYDWTASTGDGNSKSTAETCLQSIKETCRDDREIILMHHKQQTADALPGIIEYLRGEGYEFDVLTEDSPVYNFQTGWSDEASE